MAAAAGPVRAQVAPATPTPAAPTSAAVDASTTDKPWVAPASLSDWASNIKLSGQVEAGITGNPADPSNGINFGQLTTDKANHPLLNQLLLTVERDTDPKATGYDFGFKLQGLYGSDARIYHELGVFDHLIHDRNQLDIVEANVTMHTPWLFGGGIDFKGGIFPSPLGFEVIDPKGNPFYSHSYIFQYGVPFKEFGLLSTAHVSGMVDLYLGIDSGSNTTVGGGDNNSRPAGVAGLGLNFLDGKLTFLGLTHIGPENSTLNTPFGNSAIRYYNDIVITYKQSDKLSFTTEFNYVRDTGFKAEAYGVAQYVAYVLTDSLTLNGRAEVYRDNRNFFVNNPVNNLDYVNLQLGRPANIYASQRATTYGELTAGVTYKPAGLPFPLNNLLVRPEIRYDRSLSNSKPFGGGSDKDQVTLASDVILGF